MSTTTNFTLLNVSSISTPAPSSDFCITCGFDFGNIVNGVDNKIAGFIVVLLAFTLICLPCMVMACCYMCKKSSSKKYNHHHNRNKKSNKYSEVDKADDDEDGDSDGEN